MKLAILNIFACFCFVSCSTCKEDAQFKREFENCLLFIERSQGGGYATYAIERMNSIDCMYALTGYLGYVDRWNEPHYFYPDADSVPIDIGIWRKWYENNKCGFTLQMADSAFCAFSERGSVQWPKCADSLEYVEYDPSLFEVK